MDVPVDYLEGRILAHEIVDEDTGEILAAANEELTMEVVENTGPRLKQVFAGAVKPLQYPK